MFSRCDDDNDCRRGIGYDTLVATRSGDDRAGISGGGGSGRRLAGRTRGDEDREEDWKGGGARDGAGGGVQLLCSGMDCGGARDYAPGDATHNGAACQQWHSQRNGGEVRQIVAGNGAAMSDRERASCAKAESGDASSGDGTAQEQSSTMRAGDTLGGHTREERARGTDLATFSTGLRNDFIGGLGGDRRRSRRRYRSCEKSQTRT